MRWIINKTVLTRGVYNSFLLRLIYNKKISTRTVREFLIIHAVYVSTSVGKHYSRVSNKPYTKWYIKRYYKKYMFINGDKVKAQINKRRIDKKNGKQK